MTKNSAPPDILEVEKYLRARERYFDLIEELEIMKRSPQIATNPEFLDQIKSLKRTGMYIILSSSKNHKLYAYRLRKLNEDLNYLACAIQAHIQNDTHTSDIKKID